MLAISLIIIVLVRHNSNVTLRDYRTNSFAGCPSGVIVLIDATWTRPSYDFLLSCNHEDDSEIFSKNFLVLHE